MSAKGRPTSQEPVTSKASKVNVSVPPDRFKHEGSMEDASNSVITQPSYQAAGRMQEPNPDVINQVERRTEPSNVPIQFLELVLPISQPGVPSGKTGNVVPVKDPLFVTPLDRLSEVPEFIDCPFCHQRSKTLVSHEGSTATTLAGFLCCLLTCIGACIPCLCGWCEDTDHYCSHCNHHVTHKPHDGPIQVKAPRQSVLLPSKYARIGSGAESTTGHEAAAAMP